MKAFVATVRGTIPNEDACVGAEIEFVFVVKAKMTPTSTSKDTQKAIIRSERKKFLKGDSLLRMGEGKRLMR
jgi:hypothetical protein